MGNNIIKKHNEHFIPDSYISRWAQKDMLLLINDKGKKLKIYRKDNYKYFAGESIYEGAPGKDINEMENEIAKYVEEPFLKFTRELEKNYFSDKKDLIKLDDNKLALIETFVNVQQLRHPSYEKQQVMIKTILLI